MKRTVPVVLPVLLGAGIFAPTSPAAPAKVPAVAANAPPVVAAKIGFNKDIRPILAENCFACHGPDPAARKAGLRLDTEAGFFAARGNESATIVKGKPLDSPLYQRIISKDEDEIMPPRKSHKELKPAQMELIRLWIEQGAPWQPHWSFNKPERPTIPTPGPLTKGATVGGPKWLKNPIDNFILARLEGAKLTPAPEAPKNILARRVALDLTGLPPSLELLAAFTADKSPDAYDKLVDKLLDTPQFGEHRARYWLDAARYADTHGLHYDNYREMWPYRDWVIRAINRNLPFDKFTLEQIAGDLLPNPTQDQLVATGFHRCNPTTNEGGTIAEENLANYARDRVETTGWVFLGLTANCAACHDHKFDPITQKDFYSLSAFYRNTTQGALDGNVKDGRGPTMMVVAEPRDRERFDALPELIKVAKAKAEERKKGAETEFEKWLAAAKPEEIKIAADGLSVHGTLNEGAGDEVSVALSGTPKKFKSAGKIEWKTDGKLGAAPIIKPGTTVNLGDIGDFEKGQPMSYGAWVKPTGPGGAVFARMDEDDKFRGWDLWIQQNNFGTHIISQWPENALKVVTTENPLKFGEWQHLLVTYDGTASYGGVRIYLNGVSQKTKAEQDSLKDSIRTKVPLQVGQRSKTLSFDGQVQDMRIYTRKLEPAEVKALAENNALQALINVEPGKRTDAQKQTLFNYYLNTADAPFREANLLATTLETERTTIQARAPITHVQVEKMNSVPTANILMRGNYDQPKDKVEAAVPAALGALPAGAPKNRLGLAQWLVSPENPLTARVTVNRFWQEIFGTGIVKSSEDFGIMGDAPTHPELLDWLAVEFRESDWDVKRLFKTMVTSAAYRQSAQSTPEKREKDRDNRFLSRGPRFRMDAEMIRDYALAASGSLTVKIGGAPVKPYNPPGLWEVVGMSGGDTRNYRQDKGEALYRRSVYSFWKRMSPPANLEIFNAPNRETSCVRRERTNTPLQALVMMNDPQFVEAARILAENAIKSGGDDDKTLDYIADRLLCRPLLPDERRIIGASLKEISAVFVAKPADAKALIAVGESKANPALDAAKLAAWTMVTSQLINLDEVLSK